MFSKHQQLLSRQIQYTVMRHSSPPDLEILLESADIKLDEDQAEVVVKGCVSADTACARAWINTAEEQDPEAVGEDRARIPISASLMEWLETGIEPDRAAILVADELLQKIYIHYLYTQLSPFAQYFDYIINS